MPGKQYDSTYNGVKPMNGPAMQGRGLPPCTLRLSSRARRVVLSMTRRDGLVLVAPPGFDPAMVPEILARRREWIERTLTAMQVRFPDFDPWTQARIPERLDLRCIGENWDVDVLPGSGKGRALLRINAGRRLMFRAGGKDARGGRGRFRGKKYAGCPRPAVQLPGPQGKARVAGTAVRHGAADGFQLHEMPDSYPVRPMGQLFGQGNHQPERQTAVPAGTSGSLRMHPRALPHASPGPFGPFPCPGEGHSAAGGGPGKGIELRRGSCSPSSRLARLLKKPG